MPTFRTGHMFMGPKPNRYFVTTNAVVTPAGKLVMGCGAAKALAERYADAAQLFGAHIGVITDLQGVAPAECTYGLLTPLGRPFGAFQVKHHFRDPACPLLIQVAVSLLSRYALSAPHSIFYLNYPGIGAGSLSVDEVSPLLQPLPDNVHIWRFN